MADIEKPKRGFLFALLAGIALVMGLGAGMTALLAEGSATTTTAALAEIDQTGTTSSSSDTTAPAMTDADLRRACGPAGMDLVDHETARDITPIQQGALDALREICASEGMPLLAPIGDDPVVIVQTVTGPPESSPPTTLDDGDEGAGGEDGRESDDDEGEDEDDDRRGDSNRDCGSVTSERHATDAGVVEVGYDRCEAWITEVLVSDGYSYTVPINGPTHLKVEFRGKGGEAEFQAELEDGSLHVEMES